MAPRSGSGETFIGIELGSTRIKAVAIDQGHQPVATGGHTWENTLRDGIWTYSLEEAWRGIQSAFADVQADARRKLGEQFLVPHALGISGMMHGYIALDAEGNLLVPFRTWRNNTTSKASEALTRLFDYPVPQRWSIAHLYQAILDGEEHVGRIAQLTTLAGYVHWRLTGRRLLGIGEASGMFPIAIAAADFDAAMVERFDTLVADRGYGWKLRDLLPQVLAAGEHGGLLSAEGAALIDPSGQLEAGIPLCPPEGDAGTGMVATNSVEVRTGNVSAGTSVFAMVVLEKELSKAYDEIDLVTTPDGKLVAMAHSNNCSSDYNAWFSLLGEAAEKLGGNASGIYETLLPLALEGDTDCGGLLAYGYISGEHATGFDEGRPLFVRSSPSNFTLANFVRTHLFSALCALRVGLNILFEDEQVMVDEIRGHGGFFKTPHVAQRIMAAATGVPVSTLDTAGEGGAWGMALLAAFMMRSESEQTLVEFLSTVFLSNINAPVAPDSSDVDGFNAFFRRYMRGLPIERAAVECLK